MGDSAAVLAEGRASDAGYSAPSLAHFAVMPPGPKAVRCPRGQRVDRDALGHGLFGVVPSGGLSFAILLFSMVTQRGKGPHFSL